MTVQGRNYYYFNSTTYWVFVVVFHNCGCYIKMLTLEKGEDLSYRLFILQYPKEIKHWIRWHCWECPGLQLCLLYLRSLVMLTGIWIVGKVTNGLLLKLGLPICLFVTATPRENEREVQSMAVDRSGSYFLIGVRGFVWSISFLPWTLLVL